MSRKKIVLSFGGRIFRVRVQSENDDDQSSPRYGTVRYGTVNTVVVVVVFVTEKAEVEAEAEHTVDEIENENGNGTEQNRTENSYRIIATAILLVYEKVSMF